MSPLTLNGLIADPCASTKTPEGILQRTSVANLLNSLFCTKKREAHLAESLLGIVCDRGQTVDSIKIDRLS